MIDAIDFETIVKAVNENLNSQPTRMMLFDSVQPATTDAMAEINSKIKKHRLVAVLFCNPSSTFCKEEIVDSLGYFHHRSKEAIDIFCCGYGAYWPEQKYPDRAPVTKIDGEQWFYSDSAFVAAIESFESRTKWQYSGENELLLMDVGPSKDDKSLNIGSTLVCNLEQMQKDNAFTSVRSLFEGLIRYCSSTDFADAYAYSDQQGIGIAKNVLKEGVLALLPKTLQSAYSKAENYAVKQI